jgi:hypothetical protein
MYGNTWAMLGSLPRAIYSMINLVNAHVNFIGFDLPVSKRYMYTRYMYICYFSLFGFNL